MLTFFTNYPFTAYNKKDIAEKLRISPAAINGRLDTIFLNYRTYLCNDKEFKDTEEFYNLQLETEEATWTIRLNKTRQTLYQMFLTLIQRKKKIKQTKLIRQKNLKRKLQS